VLDSPSGRRRSGHLPAMSTRHLALPRPAHRDLDEARPRRWRSAKHLSSRHRPYLRPARDPSRALLSPRCQLCRHYPSMWCRQPPGSRTRARLRCGSCLRRSDPARWVDVSSRGQARRRGVSESRPTTRQVARTGRHSVLCAGESSGMAERVVTREHAAKRLHCSMRTVERMLRDGRLGAVRRDDGRLAVDPEDFDRVLADPGLLERRRTNAALHVPSGADPSAADEPPPTVERERATLNATSDPAPSRPRLTPLGDLRNATPSGRPATASWASGRRTQRWLRARRLMPLLLVLVSATAAIALIHLHTDVARNPRAARSVASGDPTTPAPRKAPRGGRAAPLDQSGAARGGRSSTVLVRAARPQTRRPPLTQHPPAPVDHTGKPASRDVINCGFGSLTAPTC
jgi:excisionase family DNA binding protein